ncbi:LuxR family transcriptional regulator [Streptomyces sp. Act143]|uniref:helix-turn-helix transcriptional regulator n=1 Tax=Streptomyces sp. Act143 TaxID=2200760 RepID=UPI000D6787C5|nr:LuxR family transcriptional regulator [Streptomyces sp. Act143]PWI19382.1 LuxR family transcriptional regulator [Streptomyces sp. Act143]
MPLGSLAETDNAALSRLSDSPAELYGRRRECTTLGALLEEVRGGHSAVVVVRGEAGVGKTTLLDHVLRSAAQDLPVIRAAGVQAERDVGFAALHQLCGSLLDRLDRLPDPERHALESVFGLRTGPVPDRLLVGLAVLDLLSSVAGERLVCVVDDAQWIDRPSAQALAFAARRLRSESMLMVFVTREQRMEFHGLPELVVGGLREADARKLLESLVDWPLEARVRDRFLGEARGNPLVLRDWARELTAELAGGYQVPVVAPPSTRLELGVQRQMAALPEQTRRLLVVAAADPTGDSALVWRAAARLGLMPDAVTPACEAGLLALGVQLRFQQTALRSAVYRAAPLATRQEAHRALADATDQDSAPDRRAWHRALATPAPDDAVAAHLERSADQAQEGGNLVAAAALLERAATLTPDPVLRVERALAAAQDKILTGAYTPARGLLALAEAGATGQPQRDRAFQLRARLAHVFECDDSTPSMLLEAARRLEKSATAVARPAYLEALTAAMSAGRLAGEGWSAEEVARAARRAPGTAGRSAADLLLDGFAAHFTEGYAEGADRLRPALDALGPGMPPREELRRLRPACIAALHLWDDRAWDDLSRRHVTLARATGALGELRPALGMRSLVLLLAGELDAVAAAEQRRAAADPQADGFSSYGELGLAVLQANESRARELIGALAERAAAGGQGTTITFTKWAQAVLCNGIGAYDQALAAAEHGEAYSQEVGVCAWLSAELVEAAVRTGAPGRASSALTRLSETAVASGSDWAAGIEARSRALLNEGDAAECLYREAVERLGRTRVRLELARAHLLYGEWLRREGRRTDAREQLRTAHEMLSAMGVQGFAARAGRELLATGETVRKRTADTANQLTAQQAQIARLACDGLSNPEISVQLFISRRTVEWHLSKIFTKLGITSRKQLRLALQSTTRPGRPHRRAFRPTARPLPGPEGRQCAAELPSTARPA